MGAAQDRLDVYEMRAELSVRQTGHLLAAWLIALRTLGHDRQWVYALRPYNLVSDSLIIAALNRSTDDKRDIRIPAASVWEHVKVKKWDLVPTVFVNAVRTAGL